MAQSFKIYIGDRYAGILLTSNPIGWMDRLWWKDKLYEVRNIEERDDGYNPSYRIAYLAELIVS